MPEDLPHMIPVYNKDAIHHASLDKKMTDDEYTATLKISGDMHKKFKNVLKTI